MSADAKAGDSGGLAVPDGAGDGVVQQTITVSHSPFLAPAGTTLPPPTTPSPHAHASAGLSHLTPPVSNAVASTSTAAPVSPAGILLLTVNALSRAARISNDQKQRLKDLLFARDERLMAAAEAYAIDRDRTELEDSVIAVIRSVALAVSSTAGSTGTPSSAGFIAIAPSPPPASNGSVASTLRSPLHVPHVASASHDFGWSPLSTLTSALSTAPATLTPATAAALTAQFTGAAASTLIPPPPRSSPPPPPPPPPAHSPFYYAGAAPGSYPYDYAAYQQMQQQQQQHAAAEYHFRMQQQQFWQFQFQQQQQQQLQYDQMTGARATAALSPPPPPPANTQSPIGTSWQPGTHYLVRTQSTADSSTQHAGAGLISPSSLTVSPSASASAAGPSNSISAIVSSYLGPTTGGVQPQPQSQPPQPPPPLLTSQSSSASISASAVPFEQSAIPPPPHSRLVSSATPPPPQVEGGAAPFVRTASQSSSTGGGVAAPLVVSMSASNPAHVHVSTSSGGSSNSAANKPQQFSYAQQLQSPSDHQHQQQQSPQFASREIDIAFMFSQPLVQENNSQPLPSPKPGSSAAATSSAAASPLVPVDMLDVSRERDWFVNALRDTGRAVKYRFECATLLNLRRVGLTIGGTAVLHWSGHGHPFALPFEDGEGGTHLLRVEQLRQFIRTAGTFSSAGAAASSPLASASAATSGAAANGQGSSSIQLVFVNACHSHASGTAFVDAGVPHVVAVHSGARITDESARTFARDFYLTLCSGKTVRQAFECGKAAVAASPFGSVRGGFASCCCAHAHRPGCVHANHNNHLPPFPAGSADAEAAAATGRVNCCCAPQVPHSDANKFLLLPLNANHDVPIFVDLPRGETRTPRVSNLPAIPSHFTGRQLDMYACVKALIGSGASGGGALAAGSQHHHSRLVTVRGVAGIGKTALAKAVAHYLAQRRVFRDGVHFVRLRGKTTVEAVRLTIATALKLAEHTDITSDSALCTALQPLTCLLILDNSEDALYGPTSLLFKQLIGRLLESAPRLVLLLTSRQSILGGGLNGEMLDFVEKLITLGPLNREDSAKLFLARAPNGITIGDLAGSNARHSSFPPTERTLLLHRKQSSNLIQSIAASASAAAVSANSPHSTLMSPLSPAANNSAAVASSASLADRLVTARLLAHHPVLDFFAGHPHAISLGAGLLQDRSLQQVHDLMDTDKDTGTSLRVDAKSPISPGSSGDTPTNGDGESQQVPIFKSLNASLQISVNHLKQTKPKAVSLFGLMGLLPSGAFPRDLDHIWAATGMGLVTTANANGAAGSNGTITDWVPLMHSLVRASLVSRVALPREMSSLLVSTPFDHKNTSEHFITFPCVTSFAKSLLTGDERRSFAKTVIEYYAAVTQELHAMMFGSSAKASYALLEKEENNLWACLNMILKEQWWTPASSTAATAVASNITITAADAKSLPPAHPSGAVLAGSPMFNGSSVGGGGSRTGSGSSTPTYGVVNGVNASPPLHGTSVPVNSVTLNGVVVPLLALPTPSNSNGTAATSAATTAVAAVVKPAATANGSSTATAASGTAAKPKTKLSAASAAYTPRNPALLALTVAAAAPAVSAKTDAVRPPVSPSKAGLGLSDDNTPLFTSTAALAVRQKAKPTTAPANGTGSGSSSPAIVPAGSPPTASTMKSGAPAGAAGSSIMTTASHLLKSPNKGTGNKYVRSYFNSASGAAAAAASSWPPLSSASLSKEPSRDGADSKSDYDESGLPSHSTVLGGRTMTPPSPALSSSSGGTAGISGNQPTTFISSGLSAGSVIGCLLPPMLCLTGRHEDALRAAKLGIAAARHVNDEVGEANCLLALGGVHEQAGTEEVIGVGGSAIADTRTAATIFRRVGDRVGLGNALHFLGSLQESSGDLHGSLLSFEEALTLFREAQSLLGEAKTLKSLGDLLLLMNSFANSSAGAAQHPNDSVSYAAVVATAPGSTRPSHAHATAERHFRRALAIYIELHDVVSECQALTSLGELQLRMGEYSAARQTLETGLQKCRTVEYRQGEANLSVALGDCCMEVNDWRRAEECYVNAITWFRELGDTGGETRAFHALSSLHEQHSAYVTHYQTDQQLESEDMDRIQEHLSATAAATPYRTKHQSTTSHSNSNVTSGFSSLAPSPPPPPPPLPGGASPSPINHRMGGSSRPASANSRRYAVAVAAAAAAASNYSSAANSQSTTPTAAAAMASTNPLRRPKASPAQPGPNSSHHTHKSKGQPSAAAAAAAAAAPSSAASAANTLPTTTSEPNSARTSRKGSLAGGRLGLLGGFGYGRSVRGGAAGGSGVSAGDHSRAAFASAVAGTSVPKSTSYLGASLGGSRAKGHSSDGDDDDDLDVWFQDATVQMYQNPAYAPTAAGAVHQMTSSTPDPDMLHAQSMAGSSDDENDRIDPNEAADGVVLDFGDSDTTSADPDSDRSAVASVGRPRRTSGSGAAKPRHARITSSDYDSDAARTDAELNELTQNWKRHSAAATAAGGTGSRGSSNDGSVAAASPLVHAYATATPSSSSSADIPPPPLAPLALAGADVAPPPPNSVPPNTQSLVVTDLVQPAATATTAPPPQS